MERLVADAVAEHPRAVAAAPPLLRQAAADRVERRGTAQVDAAGGQRAPERVDVAVGQAGEDGAAAAVDDPRRGARLPPDLVVGPDGGDHPAAPGDRRRGGTVGVERADVGADDRRRRRWACRDRIVVAHGSRSGTPRSTPSRPARRCAARAAQMSASSAPATPGSGPPTSCAARDPSLEVVVLEAEIAGLRRLRAQRRLGARRARRVAASTGPPAAGAPARSRRRGRSRTRSTRWARRRRGGDRLRLRQGRVAARRADAAGARADHRRASRSRRRGRATTSCSTRPRRRARRASTACSARVVHAALRARAAREARARPRRGGRARGRRRSTRARA